MIKEKLIKNKTFKKVLIVSFMLVIIVSFIFLINNLQEEEKDFVVVSDEPIIITEDYIYLPDLKVGYNLTGSKK